MRPPPGLRGAIPALVTPFFAGDAGTIDRAALSRLAARAAARGVGGLVACGSTGESPALSAVEHAQAVACVVEAARGLPVVAGVGAPCTEAAVALAVAAEHVGASALLVSAPPYVKPGQEGLRAHVRAVAAATGLPVVLYDVPSRAGVAFADETVARLYDDGLITALKDASGDLSRPPRLARLCGPGLVQLSGDDATALAHLAMGGQGCVSVTANVAPALCSALQSAFAARDMGFAAEIRDLLAPLDAALFAETNPVPVKAALGLLGLCAPHPRLPLTRAEPATAARLSRAMAGVMAMEEAVAAERAPRIRQVA
ncbi:4-hydroxy-tetrahydrodipicolinate synthase [Roseomonas populi]|uniref:4-hydroxy-tetrahydrodipicolinate synthase n=1 Tax=Roseomonas populi TaxID=3121582 RepID=A0ABT1X282_9PROT|nr:4-hydroxy-tetrahydrodipicolinate synthase [Roseomonas pecuniae]MCR0981513.1 4-hydroxy-tetrahydrodipicolinate synthase [Roseomonas pecuniae]